MVKEGVVDLLSRVLLLNSDVQTQEMAMQVLMNISSDGIPLNIKYYIILLGLISLYLFIYIESSHEVLIQNGVVFPLVDLMKAPSAAESVQLSVVQTLVNMSLKGIHNAISGMHILIISSSQIPSEKR